MTYILNIETATKNCSVALAKDGEILFCEEIAEEGYSHAEKLHVFIQSVLEKASLSFKDLSAVAVSQGPGSYTGLRIGVSSAKGLCLALSIPLIAVDTLQVLAAQVKVNSGLIVPMIDARRMEVYTAVFDAHLQKLSDIKPEILTENSFQDLQETVYFIGDCAEKAKTVLKKENFIFLEKVIYPSAREMALLSFNLFQQNKVESVAYFEPFYLKEFRFAK
ncbi:tRNA (adenosine(37)-N6)-threonylcarbamoyltransferase complex dimerization subunit type 1 TsaB [Flavobacterium sp.]|uniref:tRNA (adenosine(37)-N6)-threonylcarbamoyltransferase complex dimerization subunit type 1 TsaB n=1 Tax=Flavobacterium sp. TaxID=239 RepID=UPI0026357CDA|nr:tRNA (adenosine(37)-N6)-threonylcarbamoyltransferase complex dimerization subunit type 1 TsaB [Flavobacterium sp.]MDD2987111.1 tRNA (adenosine(37)-N6)-threonylcarbamoyltransferase complex dimerization subunit type 1 TsaB [Flavobacterium sp.]